MFQNDLDDDALSRISSSDDRILLTRDRGLLKRSEVVRGYWLRNTDPRAQINEVITALQLTAAARPFKRCIRCNSPLKSIREEAVRERLPVGLQGQYEVVSVCQGCDQVYWPGSHYDRLVALVTDILKG